MTRIMLFGVFGSGNFGNDATLEAMLANLAVYAPATPVCCVCPDPRLIAERYGIDTLPIDVEPSHYPTDHSFLPQRVQRIGSRLRSEFDAWRPASDPVQPGDHLVFTGTGLLDDFGVRPWNLPYDLYKWCKLAQHAHACISFMSVGAGPIVHRINRWLMLGALRSAHYRSFRDAYSRDYLAQLGFDTAKDEIYPDLVFSLPADQLPDRTPGRRPVRTVGVGVMGYYGWQNSQVAGAGVYADYIAKMNQFVLWLLHEGYEVQLLAGEYPTDERPRQDVAAYVQSAAGADVQRRVHVPAISSQQDLLAAVAGTDLVIATRFHNAVAALLLSRPVISIGYSKKNDVLLQDVGLGAFCQTVEELDVERLKAQFTGLAATLGEASEQVYQRVDMYRRALDEQYARLLSGRNEPSAAVWEKA